MNCRFPMETRREIAVVESSVSLMSRPNGSVLIYTVVFQVVETELLLRSLLDEGPQGVAHRIFEKAGVNVTKLSTELNSFM